MSFESEEAGAPPPAAGLDGVLDVELTFSRVDRSNPTLTISHFFGRAEGQEIEGARFQTLVAWCCNVLAPRAFGLIDPIRAMPEEKEPVAFDDTQTDPVLDEMRAGRIKTALFNAKNSTEGPVLTRYEEMQSLMSHALGRPPFHATRDPRTRVIDLYEALPGPNRERKVVPIERAGLGVVQVYTIVATMLFAQKRVIGVEEPEAHLHAPSTGRQLRRVLDAMLTGSEERPRIIDQLFIATHSNLFDLDPTGYWDVSIDEKTKETRVERKSLHDIDARHLVEPGPAKHLLEETLLLDGDDFVFRTSDGRRIKGAEMLDLLRRGDPVALEFLRGMNAAALQLAGLDARDDTGEAAQ